MFNKIKNIISNFKKSDLKVNSISVSEELKCFSSEKAYKILNKFKTDHQIENNSIGEMLRNKEGYFYVNYNVRIAFIPCICKNKEKIIIKEPQFLKNNCWEKILRLEDFNHYMNGKLD